ncbi:hypothetical protein XENOCAPTIV_017689, partial [Xenoophorus captivus]
LHHTFWTSWMESDRLLTRAEDGRPGDYGSGSARCRGDSQGSRRMSCCAAGDGDTGQRGDGVGDRRAGMK